MNTNDYPMYMEDAKPKGYLSEAKGIIKLLGSYINRIAELKLKNKELHRITETQTKIISILAHDVRNPLASIKNIIELKQADILDAHDAGEMMDLVTGQLNNTLEMVDTVVNWGQTHLQLNDVQDENFDLHQLVHRIFGSELLVSVAKNNRLINNIPDGTIVSLEPRALEFILRNLISNANKFTEDGTITVSMERNESNVILKVSDTGVGMSAEQAAKLLNTNDTNTTLGTKKEKGSGLGLLLIKEFVERMNGTISVASEVSKGTCFTIVL